MKNYSNHHKIWHRRKPAGSDTEKQPDIKNLIEFIDTYKKLVKPIIDNK